MLRRSRSLSFALVLASLAVILCIYGCGEDGEEVDPLAEGWGFYEEGNYSNAIEMFEDAIASKPVDAYVGLGWTYGKMADLQECIASFQSALSADPQNPDALAGIALAYLADDQYDQAVANASQALAINPGYSFGHDNITSRNLHIVLAESYYYKGDFVNAREEIIILGEPDPPADPVGLLEALKRVSGG